jgi:putative ATP-dependent endonuclease of OLD family
MPRVPIEHPPHRASVCLDLLQDSIARGTPPRGLLRSAQSGRVPGNEGWHRISALDLILGEFWPGTRELEDHYFWNREKEGGHIEIMTQVEGIRDHRGFIDRFTWKYTPASHEEPFYRAYYQAGGNPVYVRSELRDQLIRVVLGADRRLAYQLSYASKWTLLSKLMKRFHGRLTKDEKRIVRLKEKFRNIKDIFAEVDKFAGFQSGPAQQFSELFSGSYGLNNDFSAYDPSNYFHSLKILPHEEGEIRTFEELGTGQEQLLSLAFVCAYAQAFYGGIILVIEEPESHLHPLAQQ